MFISRVFLLSIFSFSTFLGATDVRSIKPIFVGISGGSGAGKSHLSDLIFKDLKGDVVCLEEDSYYRPLGHLTPEERARVNFDHPDSLDFDLLKKHMLDLKKNKSILKPVYNFKTHSREEQTVKVEPRPYVVIDGILLLAMPEIRELLDLKVFLDAPDDLRVLRRVERDIAERGRKLENVVSQYILTVKPMHDQFVAPSKWHADVILPTMTPNAVGTSAVVSKMMQLRTVAMQ